MTALTRHRSATVAALALVALAALTGCAPDATTAGPAEDAANRSAWPRTIDHDGAAIEIAAPPERIVALSTETGDIALQLVGAEHVAAVSSGSTTDGATIDEAAKVETVLPPGTSPDPEQVLSLNPDLVLITARHPGEEDAAAVLADAGVPSIVFASEDFATPRAVADSVRLLGDALGAEEEAGRLAAGLEDTVDEIEAAVADVETRPRVLALMARGDKTMISGTGSTLVTLTELAGGTAVAAEQGWHGTVPAEAEQVIVADPDVILVEDFRGAGLAPFETLLNSGALADVPAIVNDEVHLIPSAVASGSAGLRLAEGLRTVAETLHPESSAR